MRRTAVLVFVFAGLLVTAAPAAATYHLNRIKEVHAGPAGAGSGNYIELQAAAPGQNFVSAHYLATYDNGGNLFGSMFQFPNSVANGANQATILVSDGGPLPGGVAPDFTDPTLNVLTGGGSVCFMDTPTVGLDCVTYGTSSPPIGAPSPVGTPVGFGGSVLTAGQSLVRSIAPGCATLFELSDDTNDSSADFAIGPPTPRNNSTAPTEKPCIGGGGGGGGGTPDTTPPNTKLKKRPKAHGLDRTPTVRFTATEAGSTFQCKIDKKKFRACKSPLTLKTLKFGAHKLQVRAIDAAGNVDATPAKVSFKVIRPKR